MEKQLSKYILSNVLAMIGTSCYVLADTFFISVAAGSLGITALNLTLPLYGIIFAVGSMIGVGSATRYSLERSSQKGSGNDYFFNAVVWSVIISCFFVVCGIFIPDKILALLGADPQILKIGLPYMRIVLLFTPFFMVNYTFTSFVRNDNAPKLAMTATLVSGIFNIVLDYILMFPMKMGMTGAALATGISPIVSMGICSLHYFSKNNNITFTLSVPSFKKLINACYLGISALIGELSSGITTLIFNFLLLKLSGNTAVAAYGIIANIALVGISLFNGISLGLQPVASYIHGKGDFPSEKRVCRRSVKLGLFVACIIVVSIITFSDVFISVFNNENSRELADMASVGIKIYFTGFIAASVNIIKSGFYSAVGKGKESAAISLSRGIFTIILTALLLSKFLGIIGVWLAFPVSEIITLLISLTADVSHEHHPENNHNC